MASSNPSTTSPSRVPTPNRFTTQASTAEDLLKSQTVGLVHLSDFRKRRAEALEQKEREATGSSHSNLPKSRFAPSTPASGAANPDSVGSHNDGISSPKERLPKKRKAVKKGGLSFGIDNGDDEGNGNSNVASSVASPRSSTPALDDDGSSRTSPAPINTPNETRIEKKRLGPNAILTVAPKAMTKPALRREAQTRETLRKEFLSMQESVKAAEIIIPFVFYDGTNIPGGACKVKKGDYIWLFLDRSRKVGAELGVGGEGKASRREWARVGVDDLMLVRGEVIIPHHYEIYHFIANKTLGPNSLPLFGYSSVTAPKSRSRSPDPEEEYDPISLPADSAKARRNGEVTERDRGLEGRGDDPTFTKVVDRRWYERNKHIFPASVWEEYDPGKDYTRETRKDALGNAFFFS